MRKCLNILAAIFIASLLFQSCKQKPKSENIEPTYSTFRTDSSGAEIPTGKREIFYGILTPVEISSIFGRLGALYEPQVLNNDENGNNYNSSAKAALNLGIYGVDLSYLKMFDMNTEMVHYMLTVRSLSEKLGIPAEYLTEPIEELETNMSDSDSVLVFVNKAYKRIEDHLAIDGRESTAGLIILGGWIEALYIATQQLYDPSNPDPEVIERIAEQKYTLNTLLSFLKNYYDDPVVVYYTKKLKFLKKYFDNFDIYYRKGDLEIDRDKQVLRASSSDMTITLETLENIRDYVYKMRTETVGL